MTFVYNTAENIGLRDLNQYIDIDIPSYDKIVMHSNALFHQYIWGKKIEAVT